MRQGLSSLGHRFAASLMLRSPVNRAAAWVVAVIGPLIVAAGLLSVRSSVGLAGFLSGALLAVIVAAVIGGLWPALASAALALLLGGYLYAPPYDSVVVDVPADIVAFVGFVIVAGVLGLLVDQLAGLAQRQAALRRVATLVGRAAPPDDVFAAVMEEVGQQLPGEHARMARYDADNSVTFVAAWPTPDEGFPVGSRWALHGESVTRSVLRTGRPARIENYGAISGPLASDARKMRIRSSVGAPIVVDGRLWGVMLVGSSVKRALPADTEARLGSFTDLLATAIANAERRAEVVASRARIVAAADETRRRIERELHDGTQQRLVSLAMELRAAEDTVPPELPEVREMFTRARRDLANAVEDLQEIARGIHPAILSTAGLKPAISTLARRSAVPVQVDVDVDERLPQQIEVAAYYVVSEALTNVAKYAHASVAHVDVHSSPSVIELAVRDDGVGGADPSRGSGLIGLRDRVEALGGTITIAGGAGEGTAVVARIPIDGKRPPSADGDGSVAVRS